MRRSILVMLAGLATALAGAGSSHAATREVTVHHWVRRGPGVVREVLARLPATVEDGRATVRLRRERGGRATQVVEVRFEDLDTPVTTATLRQVDAHTPPAAVAFEAGRSVLRVTEEGSRWSLHSLTAEGDDPAALPAPGSWELEVAPGPAPRPAARLAVALRPGAPLPRR